MCAALRADLLSEYGVHLHSMYEASGPSCILIASLAVQLPDSSRTMKRLRNDCFDQKEHLLADLVDLLGYNSFMSNVSASAAAGKEAKKIFKKAPTPMERPMFKKPTRAKFKFMSGRELKERFGGGEVGPAAVRKRKRGESDG